MTNKKAIKRLQSWIDSGYYSINKQDINWEEDKQAIEFAIQALKSRLKDDDIVRDCGEENE